MPTVRANTVFNVFDLLVGIMIVIGGFASFAGTFTGIIIPVYQILFGVLIVIMVFYVPESLGAVILFYMNFLGRGLTFLFLGCLSLVGPGPYQLKVAVAIITLIVAFVYIILWVLQKLNVLPVDLPPPFLQSDEQSDGGDASVASKPSETEKDADAAPVTPNDAENPASQDGQEA